MAPDKVYSVNGNIGLSEIIAFVAKHPYYGFQRHVDI